MADTFPIRLLTPAGIVFEGDAEELYAVGGLGEFGILPEHVNFITSLRPGFLEIKTSEGARTYFATGGLAEVKDGSVTVLADSIEDPGAIDVTGLDEKIAEAERKLSALVSCEEAEYVLAEQELFLALARKQAAAQSGKTESR